jgi:Flp pilus assembly pilin Flp
VNTVNKQPLQTLSFLLSHARPRKVLARQSGQGMTEYIIIVALVAVAAIGVYQYFGQVMRSQTAAVAKELAGEDGTAQTKAAKSAAQGASTQTKAKTLKGFTGNASAAKR